MVAGAAIFTKWWEEILLNDLNSWYNSYQSDLEMISKEFVDNGMGNIARRIRILIDTELPAAEWKRFISAEMTTIFLICKSIIHHDSLAPELAEEVFNYSGLNIFKIELEKRPPLEKKILCIAQETGRDEQIVWRKNTYIEEDTGQFLYTSETAFRFFERNEKPLLGEIFKTEMVYYPGCNFGGGRIHILNQQMLDEPKFNPTVTLNNFDLWSKARAQLISTRPWLNNFILMVKGIQIRQIENELFIVKDKFGKKISLPASSSLQKADFLNTGRNNDEINYIFEETPNHVFLKGAIQSGSIALF